MLVGQQHTIICSNAHCVCGSTTRNKDRAERRIGISVLHIFELAGEKIEGFKVKDAISLVW